jgi:hypothetical protein
MHGFVCAMPIGANCFKVVDVLIGGVLQTMTQVNGLSRDKMVGSFRDKDGEAHGYVCAFPLTPTCFVQIDASRVTNTEVLGLNVQGFMIGRYQDKGGRLRAFVSGPQ